MRLVVDVIEYSARELPRFNPISISGYHIREAGSTAIEEVAFTLAHALAYAGCAAERGLDLAPLLRRFSFFFNAQMDLFEEVAKFRAARRLWATLVRERLRIDDDDAARLRFHAQTAGAALTYQEQENNVVRVTVQALAAVLGGAQSLHTNSSDEALGLPSEASVRTALRTQQILAHETGVADVVDPLGGAPLVEYLTDEIAARARALLEEIDRRGGPLRAVEEGWIQRRIEESAYRHQQAVERGARVVVGVNRFQAGGVAGPAPEVFTVDPRLETERVARLRQRKAQRSEKTVRLLEQHLEALKLAAKSSENLMGPLVDAVEAGASVGETMRALASVFGEYQGGM
jgi:methylmalonyl-CoA mutase N-terminal domain/subunit